MDTIEYATFRYDTVEVENGLKSTPKAPLWSCTNGTPMSIPKKKRFQTKKPASVTPKSNSVWRADKQLYSDKNETKRNIPSELRSNRMRAYRLKEESWVKLLKSMTLSDLFRQSPLVENSFIVSHETRNARGILPCLNICQKWQKWESQLPCLVKIPRALPPSQEPVNEIVLHNFGDASGKGLAAAVCTVVSQPAGTHQGLLFSGL